MKIDTSDFGVYEVTVSAKDAAAWLMGDKPDLAEVNGAIDNAVSHAGAYGSSAFILIKIVGDDT